MKFPKSCKVIMYFNRFFEITQFQNESQKSFLWLNFLMSHKRLIFSWKNFFQEVIHPQIFFVIYLYLDASAKRIFKQKSSLADLMHSHISKSDHSALPNKDKTYESHFTSLSLICWASPICLNDDSSHMTSALGKTQPAASWVLEWFNVYHQYWGFPCQTSIKHMMHILPLYHCWKILANFSS